MRPKNNINNAELYSSRGLSYRRDDERGRDGEESFEMMVNRLRRRGVVRDDGESFEIVETGNRLR